MVKEPSLLEVRKKFRLESRETNAQKRINLGKTLKELIEMLDLKKYDIKERRLMLFNLKYNPDNWDWRFDTKRQLEKCYQQSSKLNDFLKRHGNYMRNTVVESGSHAKYGFHGGTVE